MRSIIEHRKQIRFVKLQPKRAKIIKVLQQIDAFRKLEILQKTKELESFQVCYWKCQPGRQTEGGNEKEPWKWINVQKIVSENGRME